MRVILERYRIQSDSFPHMWHVMSELVIRLTGRFNTGSSLDRLVYYDSPLPLQEYFEIIDQHFEVWTEILYFYVDRGRVFFDSCVQLSTEGSHHAIHVLCLTCCTFWRISTYITTHFRSPIFCIVSRVDKRSITYSRHWLSYRPRVLNIHRESKQETLYSCLYLC